MIKNVLDNIDVINKKYLDIVNDQNVCIENRIIKLGGKRGGYTIISPSDYNLVSKYNWYQDQDGYARCGLNSYTLHRIIMNPPKNLVIDHINHNRLDNRRENLRILTTLQNNQNRKLTKIKYRGVCFCKKSKKYRVKFTLNHKNVSLGSHNDEITAAETYDMYIVHNKLDHIHLNFPDKKDDYLKRKYTPFISIREKSQYIGVYKYEDGISSYASIGINGKNYKLCTNVDPVVCAKKYDEYIVTNNVPNKKLNFPSDYPNYNPLSIIKTECKIMDENTVQLLTTKNKRTILIDKEDYDKIKYFKVYINKEKYVCFTHNFKNVRLHRFLMNETNPNIIIDHIDGNPLNNKKSNLRRSDALKNGQNKSKSKRDLTSQYMGISQNKAKSLYLATICKKYIGCSKNEIDVARLRDLYIMKHHPESHYKFNFEWTQQDIEEWKTKLNFK